MIINDIKAKEHDNQQLKLKTTIVKHDLKRLLEMTFLKNVCGVHFEEDMDNFKQGNKIKHCVLEFDGKWQGNESGEDQGMTFKSYFCKWIKDAKKKEGAREDLNMIIEESKHSNLIDECSVDWIKAYLNMCTRQSTRRRY